MNEDNNNQHTEEQSPSDETQAELREISKEELEQILDEQEKWSLSDGKEGKRADLGKANLLETKFIGGVSLKEANFEGANLQNAYLKEAFLQKANLCNANLQEANLEVAKLQEADLSKANLQKANLWGANLQKANLYNAKLQEADLEGANLQEAEVINANLQKASLYGADLQEAYLEGTNLQGADLSKANLQKADLSKADMQNTVLNGVEGLNEAEDLRYANFEGATGLLGNEFAQTDVTGTKLPDDIKDFKALENVKEASQNARKIFFAMLLGCVYSWLTIATTTDVKLITNTASSPLPIIGTEIPIAGFYFAAPLVLMCLYFYFHLYLLKQWEALASLPAIFPDGKRLDERAYPWLLNGLVRRHFKRLKSGRPFIAHIAEWITIILAWWVVPLTMMAFWLRYIPRHELIGTSIHIVLLIISIASSLTFYQLSKTILQGDEIETFSFKNFWHDKKFYYVILIGFILIVLSLVGFAIWGANFREKDISIKPSDYYKIEPVEKQVESVKGADLKGRNLNNADMYGAFLVKADLRGASLKGANLEGANLQKADLSKVNLQDASFNSADLTGAKNLTIDQLSKTKTIYKTKLDPELLKQVEECCPHLLEKPKDEKDNTK